MNKKNSCCMYLVGIIRNPAVAVGIFFMSIILLTSTNSHAYIGPGAGVTMLGALWGVILAVIFAIGGLLIWPIRILLRRRKIDKAIHNNSQSDE